MEFDDLIKLILGALLVVAVIVAVALFFKDNVIAFFKGLSVGEKTGIFLTLIR